jgi:hypothetical protein
VWFANSSTCSPCLEAVLQAAAATAARKRSSEILKQPQVLNKYHRQDHKATSSCRQEQRQEERAEKAGITPASTGIQSAAEGYTKLQ